MPTILEQHTSWEAGLRVPKDIRGKEHSKSKQQRRALSLKKRQPDQLMPQKIRENKKGTLPPKELKPGSAIWMLKASGGCAKPAQRMTRILTGGESNSEETSAKKWSRWGG